MSAFSSKTVKADPRKLVLILDPSHPRFDPRVLAPIDPVVQASIAARGVVQTITITPDGEVLDGRHRVRAAIAADIDEVPVRVVNAEKLGVSDDVDSVLFAHEMNAVRTAADPLQQAKDAQRAIDAGKPRDVVARAMGIKESKLDALLTILNKGTEIVVRALEAGAIDTTVAEIIASRPADQQAIVLATAKDITKAAADAKASGDIKGKRGGKTAADGSAKVTVRDAYAAVAAVNGKSVAASYQRKSDEVVIDVTPVQSGPRTGPVKKDELAEIMKAVESLFSVMGDLSSEEKASLRAVHGLLSLVKDGTAIGGALAAKQPRIAAALMTMRA